MKNFLTIAVFTLLVSLLYTAVGHVIPQMESRPPDELVVGTNISSEDLVPLGAGVFDANCLQCHKIGRTDRCPDMSGMGQRAKERAQARAAATGKAYDDVDFILESLCKPGEYLTPGYESLNIMPGQGKLLSGGQMLAVAAFLQDLGGTATADIKDKAAADARLARFGCVTGGSGGAEPVELPPVGAPAEVFAGFGCVGCHAMDRPDRGLGPSLQDVGKRLDRGALYEAILAPDASMPAVEPPYPVGLMKMTLDSNGFYERMTPADYKALVDWLAAKAG